MIAASEDRQYHLLDDGAWWEVTLAQIPTYDQTQQTRYGQMRTRVEKQVRDAVVAPGLSRLTRSELYDRPGVYAATKRQLSKKEMKKLGLH